MKITTTRSWFGISPAVTSLAVLTYSMGYATGVVGWPQIQSVLQHDEQVTPFHFNGADYTVDQFGVIRDSAGRTPPGAPSNVALNLAAAVAVAGDIPLAPTPAMLQPVEENENER